MQAWPQPLGRLALVEAHCSEQTWLTSLKEPVKVFRKIMEVSWVVKEKGLSSIVRRDRRIALNPMGMLYMISYAKAIVGLVLALNWAPVFFSNRLMSWNLRRRFLWRRRFRCPWWGMRFTLGWWMIPRDPAFDGFPLAQIHFSGGNAIEMDDCHVKQNRTSSYCESVIAPCRCLL
jgi:hypothetical protein